MRLKALLLTLVIGFGLTAPMAAKTKHPKSPRVQHGASHKMPKAKQGKVKPMKYKKGKRNANAKAAKPHSVKVHKSKTPHTV